MDEMTNEELGTLWDMFEEHTIGAEETVTDESWSVAHHAKEDDNFPSFLRATDATFSDEKTMFRNKTMDHTTLSTANIAVPLLGNIANFKEI